MKPATDNRINDPMTDPMTARIAALEAQSQAECARMALAEEGIRAAHRKLRVTWAVSAFAALAMLSVGWHKDAIAQGYGMTLAQAATRIGALETKTASMSAIIDPNTNKPTVRFSSVNVQIVDGTGKTENRDAGDALVLSNGTGNLIVGYNEMRASNYGPNIRTGSHNLVVGLQNNYGGVGGAVIGYNNAISYEEACVLGGINNTASVAYSSVSGGISNTASGFYSTVSGGFGNTASGFYSTVSGGTYNKATNDASSVSGGVSNQATGSSSTVSGGVQNIANGLGSVITGGSYIRQNNLQGFSAGGINTASQTGIGVYHAP